MTGAVKQETVVEATIRYDKPGRFVPDTYSVELRAGTKDAKVQQFIEQVATAVSRRIN